MMNPLERIEILIAEDDRTTREGLRDLLDLEGYAVRAAADGQEAWTCWQEARPQLLLLDIMMPGLDGYELCRRVRREDARIPVIFLSAKAEEIDRVIGLELGADDFLPKPFGARELLARVKSVLRRSALAAGTGSDSDEFEIAGLRVSPARLECWREDGGGRAIELSERECRILALLARRPREAIRRDTFYDEVWGYDHMPNSRSLDQQISQLRHKIELDPAQPRIILTAHGVGYRLGGGGMED